MSFGHGEKNLWIIERVDGDDQVLEIRMQFSLKVSLENMRNKEKERKHLPKNIETTTRMLMEAHHKSL